MIPVNAPLEIPVYLNISFPMSREPLDGKCFVRIAETDVRRSGSRRTVRHRTKRTPVGYHDDVLLEGHCAVHTFSEARERGVDTPPVRLECGKHIVKRPPIDDVYPIVLTDSQAS